MPRRDPPEELRLHVLAHQPVIPAERVLRALDRAAFPQVERGQVQPGGPPFCPLVQRGHVVVAERDVSRVQQRGGLLAAQRQLGRPDLQDPALDAQPRYPQRRGVAARQYQPRPWRDVIGQHRQRVPAFGIPEQVRVVEHQHHGRGHRPERRPQPRHHRAWDRAGVRCERLEHLVTDRLHRVQRRRHVAEQDLRVVVPVVEGHPGERLAVACCPLCQQRRLAVPGRRDHRDDRGRAVRRQPADQRGAGDGSWPRGGAAELGGHKVEPRPGRRPRLAGILPHAVRLHPPKTAPFPTVYGSMLGSRLFSRQENSSSAIAPRGIYPSSSSSCLDRMTASLREEAPSLRNRPPRSRPQEGQHREHPPVVGVGRRQAQLAEDVADVLLDGAV